MKSFVKHPNLLARGRLAADLRAACGHQTPGRRVPATAQRGGEGKSVLITGGNTGIGFVTAKELAAQGYATVIACRNMDKACGARDKIKAQVPGAKVEAVPLDLANLQSVRDLANRCLDGGRPLDVLINNAGVMACPEMRTADGFELQLGVNHLGHCLFTTMLLPLLSTPDRPARIINVSSSAHKFGTINFEDINSCRNYRPWVAYGQSKLANCLFTYELAKRLPRSANVTVNALHPGIVNTELGRYLISEDSIQWWQRPLVAVARSFGKTPEQGAETSIYLAASPEVEGVSSKYYVDSKPVTSSKASYDADVARRLWDLSAEMTGADVDIGA